MYDDNEMKLNMECYNMVIWMEVMVLDLISTTGCTTIFADWLLLVLFHGQKQRTN